MMKIKKNCPTCKQDNNIIIEKNKISCANPECSFETTFCCPVCDTELGDDCFSENQKGEIFYCQKCDSTIPVNKVIYLIENSMIVDHKELCTFCNGPTIHRININLGKRCFFFPSCSGQADLFGAEKETLTFLDFETTGFDPVNDNIIEIGAVKIDEEGIEHTFQTLINPGLEIPARITDITGISTAMLENEPDIKDSIQKLVEFIGTSKIVAHNAEFDIPWLIKNATRANVTLRENPIICTLKWARALEEGRCSLTALTKKYAILHQNAHRALADAMATKEIFFIFEGRKSIPRPASKFSDYTTLVT